jgi:hypothetical protein
LPRTLGPHLTVWGAYLCLFGLLYLNMRRAPVYADSLSVTPRPFPWRTFLVFGIVFALTAALGTLTKGLAIIGVVVSWLICPSLGLLILAQSALIALGVKQPQRKKEWVDQ